MMQLTTTSSRWGAVSSIALLCSPSSCVCLVNATGSTAGSRKKTTTAGRQTTERILFIAEGLCIGLAVVSHTAAVIHPSTRKPVAVEAPLSANNLSMSTWQVLPLWGAILLNVIL
ncbi:unnamed protein product [Sphagnum jensenii]|uniref:Secreted protein n=1 Tax=Sphagnum jensenii TaxID=128206 RepID=A0ABP0ZZ37_9BRYO